MAFSHVSLDMWTCTTMLLSSLATIGLLHILRIRYRSDLKNIPGPFPASFSNLDRIRSCATGRQMDYHLTLHKRYVSFVRVGPNHVSFSDVGLIPAVYGVGSGFEKSEFYSMFDVKTSKGEIVPSIFSVRDEKRHREMKKPIAAAYSLGTMKELEERCDACSEELMGKLESFVGQTIDLGAWLHFYAFDVITSITFSATRGMLSAGKDVQGILAAVEGRLVYNSIIGQVPWLHKYLFGNTVVSWLANWIPAVRRLNSAGKIVEFARERLRRWEERGEAGDGRDMLDRFKRTKKSKDDGAGENEVISEAEMLAHASGHIFAGSDTTATTLRTIFYHLARSPRIKNTLLSELSSLPQGCVAFSASQPLPYLSAVIKESLRICPPVGMLLERVVHVQGLALPNGVCLHPGTVVGINPWVAARSKEVYGEDVEVFRPERWLEADEEELKGMERASLAFGAGARTCIGSNISLLEIYKIVPQILNSFDFELVDEDEWETRCFWFVKQKSLGVRVLRREGGKRI